jgi:hypothetical protein
MQSQEYEGCDHPNHADELSNVSEFLRSHIEARYCVRFTVHLLPTAADFGAP